MASLPVYRGAFSPFSDCNSKMSLHLHTSSPLCEIQSEFSKNFPGLKLEFIFHGDEQLNLSSNLHHSFLYTPVNEFLENCTCENIIIEDSMTLKEVESIFKTSWHLPAQVYVITGGYWQKSRSTEGKQLKEYNNPFV